MYRQLRPRFPEFLCEWTGCKAELHNLETLRRHVLFVHGGSGCRCFWGKCMASVATADEFRSHVEEAHMVPVAWHMGDGPRNWSRYTGGDGEDGQVPDYLLDEHGVQVTPSIRDQEVEDVLTWRMNRRKLKELLIRRDENLPDEDSDEEGEEEEVS